MNFLAPVDQLCIRTPLIKLCMYLFLDWIWLPENQIKDTYLFHHYVGRRTVLLLESSSSFKVEDNNNHYYYTHQYPRITRWEKINLVKCLKLLIEGLHRNTLPNNAWFSKCFQKWYYKCFVPVEVQNHYLYFLHFNYLKAFFPG